MKDNGSEVKFELYRTNCKVLQNNHEWHHYLPMLLDYENRPCKNCLYNDGTCEEAKEGAQQAWTSRHMPVK